MNIRITDKFLWDMYQALDKTGDILRFLTKRPTMANYLPGPKNPIFDHYRKELGRARFNKMVYHLKKNNYIRSSGLKNNKAILITKKGLDKILKASFKMGERPKRKDGRWIMLIFDIPQKYKKSRNLMTSILHNLGYKMFQQSVWITQYDVSEKTEKSLQFYNLDKFVKIFLIEKL